MENVVISPFFLLWNQYNSNIDKLEHSEKYNKEKLTQNMILYCDQCNYCKYGIFISLKIHFLCILRNIFTILGLC